MSAPEQAPLDAELAWAISSWPGIGPDDGELSREGIESLARHLTAQGFTNKKPEDPFEHIRKLRPTVERMFASVEEVLGGKNPRATAANPAD